jgi:hypothetical protein
MFGTTRHIKEFVLQVHRLLETDAEERCVLIGNVEWVYEEEFSSHRDTVPDELAILVYVRSERFERLLGTIGDGSSAELTVMIDGVDGFYADWSPDIKTSSVKVLTPQQHEPEIPEGCTIRPPVLGAVRQFNVSVVRTLKAEEPQPPVADDNDDLADVPPASPESSLGAIALAVLTRLDRMQYALWGVIVALVLLLIFKH